MDSRIQLCGLSEWILWCFAFCRINLIPLFYVCSFATAAVCMTAPTTSGLSSEQCCVSDPTMHTFYIKNLWNGIPDPNSEQVKLTLSGK